SSCNRSWRTRSPTASWIARAGARSQSLRALCPADWSWKCSTTASAWASLRAAARVSASRTRAAGSSCATESGRSSSSPRQSAVARWRGCGYPCRRPDMLRCFIADDEPAARQRLQRLLSALPELCVVGEAADGASALERIAASRPDVLLLDIAMPELDGLGVAAALAAAPQPVPAIIFVTAYDDHALRAFELAAVDYLVKPVQAERLAAALARVTRRGLAHGASAAELSALLAQLQSAQPLRRMAARSGAKFIVFDPARVYGIFARDHYSLLLLEQQELLLELTHEGDRRYVAVLADPAATRVPVSRERLPALRAALGLE